MGCLPHARGGVSGLSKVFSAAKSSSPRSWGCFTRADVGTLVSSVFPTLVGVFHSRRRNGMAVASLPHARGGVSKVVSGIIEDDSSSPRSWGCFHEWQGTTLRFKVFPTLVGVFPVKADLFQRGLRLPHARGGVSRPAADWKKLCPSSPRSWGCFRIAMTTRVRLSVFPTLVGVFPLGGHSRGSPCGLPHARGGVSFHLISRSGIRQSSPRSWGCFLLSPLIERTFQVFPTLVGVFPLRPDGTQRGQGLPHARGGVSFRDTVVRTLGSSSPRSWGCFYFALSAARH